MKRNTTKALKINHNGDVRRQSALPFEIKELLKGTGQGGRGGVTTIKLDWDWDSTYGERVISKVTANFRNGDVDVYDRNIFYSWCMKKNEAESIKVGETYTRATVQNKKESKAIGALFLKAPGAITVTTGGLIGGIGVDTAALNAALFAAGNGDLRQACKAGSAWRSESESVASAARNAGMSVADFEASFGRPAPVVEEGL